MVSTRHQQTDPIWVSFYKLVLLELSHTHSFTYCLAAPTAELSNGTEAYSLKIFTI